MQPARKAAIASMADATAPFVHSKSLALASAFLELKRRSGTDIERDFYANMNVTCFLTRLLTHRPMVFVNFNDQYVLRTGETGAGMDVFPAIGTSNESAPLVLRDYLSYDEMDVSALLGVAVPTYLINDGARDNDALVGAEGSFEEEAVIVDQVGCRFERKGLMEYKHMVATPEQNTASNGYGPSNTTSLLSLFASLYGLPCFPTFDTAQADARAPGGSARWEVKHPDLLLNIEAFRSRYTLQAEAFLAECSHRGATNAGAYCSVAESVATEPWWTISDTQALWMLQGFKHALSTVAAPAVRVLDFPLFNETFFREVFGQPGSTVVGAAGNTITIRNSRRNPASKLAGADAGLRVVHQFAGDSNAYLQRESNPQSPDPARPAC